MPRFNIPFNQVSNEQKEILKRLCSGKRYILEVGCWLGESTSILAEEAKKNGGWLCAVDWWEGNPGTNLTEVATNTNIYEIFINNMRELDLLNNIVIIKGDSTIVHNEINKNTFDMVYLDGDHRYSGISKDIDNFYPKLKEGGLLAGHDCEGKEYNEQYIEQDYIESKHHGVIKAVNERFKDVAIEQSIWQHIKESK